MEQEYASITKDGMTVESNFDTQESLAASFEVPKPGATTEPATQTEVVVDPAKAPGEKPVEKPTEQSAGERNADGTFKAKETAEQQKERNRREDPQVAVKTAIAKQREAERRAEDAERRARDIEARQVAPPPPKPVEQPPAQRAVVNDPRDPEPDPADVTKYPEGQYDRAFIKDQARWEVRQEFASQQRESRQRFEQEQAERVVHERAVQFHTRLSKATTADPEFLSRIHPDVLNMKPSSELKPGERADGRTAIADMLLESEQPDAVMRHFTDHYDDFQRLSTLHPIQVIREMGKLEARLEAASLAGPAPTLTHSQAHPPISPVRSAPNVADTPPGDDADDDAHARWMNRRELQSRQGRRG